MTTVLFIGPEILKIGNKEITFNLFFWPPQSHDLNPIENVWFVLKNHVKRNIFYIKNTEDLKNHLQAAWNILTVAYLQSLYRTIPKGYRQVLIS